MKKLISSRTKWEVEVGYSRAVRVGNIIEVAGTTAVLDGAVVGKGDPAAQTVCILNKIKNSLEEAGSGLKDVVRTRIFVKDINQWEIIGKAHGQFFKEIKPASTMVEVSALIDAELLVEIEATAIVHEA